LFPFLGVLRKKLIAADVNVPERSFVRPRILRAIAFFSLGLAVVTHHDQAFSETSSSETIKLLQEENADTISFREKVAFISPSGEEITPTIGTYQVEPVGLTALRLVSFGRKDMFVIKAEQTSHEEDVGFPVALMLVDDEFLIHVVLLLPEQKRLEAIGSSSLGRSRGKPELLTPAQIHDAFMRRKATPSNPPRQP
jgi:hypothetical protein